MTKFKTLVSWSSGKDSAWMVHVLRQRGEFHSVAYRGPMFRHPIAVEQGAVLERDGYQFADVLLRGPAAP